MGAQPQAMTGQLDGRARRRKVSQMTDQLDSLFGALADPTRRAIVQQLATGPASVGALHTGHAMALPTFMRHLQVLADSGIIVTVKRGRVRTCQLETAPLVAVQGWLAWQRAIWENRD